LLPQDRWYRLNEAWAEATIPSPAEELLEIKGVMITVLFKNPSESIKILGLHEDIQIIIPGNKASVPDGTESRATHQTVIDMMGLTQLIDIYGYP
jgi:hypothetical protein